MKAAESSADISLLFFSSPQPTRYSTEPLIPKQPCVRLHGRNPAANGHATLIKRTPSLTTTSDQVIYRTPQKSDHPDDDSFHSTIVTKRHKIHQQKFLFKYHSSKIQVASFSSMIDSLTRRRDSSEFFSLSR